MTQRILTSKLGLHWQMSQVNFADKIVYLHNIEHYKSPPPYNTTLGSRES